MFRISLSALRALMRLLCQQLWSSVRKRVKRVIRPSTLVRRAAMMVLALGQSAGVKVSILCWPLRCKRSSSQGRGCAGQSSCSGHFLPQQSLQARVPVSQRPCGSLGVTQCIPFESVCLQRKPCLTPFKCQYLKTNRVILVSIFCNV